MNCSRAETFQAAAPKSRQPRDAFAIIDLVLDVLAGRVPGSLIMVAIQQAMKQVIGLTRPATTSISSVATAQGRR